MAPTRCFTCDEIWQVMPHRSGDDGRNVVFNEMNQPFAGYALDEAAMARWDRLIAVRDAVNGALEAARAEKKIGKALEAKVKLTVPAEDAFLAEMDAETLADLLIVSQAEASVGGGLSVSGGGALAANHLYMMTVENRGVKAGADTVKLLVRGTYTIG